MDLARILDNLTAHIPTPRRAAPVPQQSFASLKVGQRVASRTSHYIGKVGVTLVRGTVWLVAGTDDQGALVVLEQDPTVTQRVDRDWRDLFDRVAAKRVAKTAIVRNRSTTPQAKL